MDSPKENEFTLKWLKVAILLWEATENGSFLKMFELLLLFRKKNRFWEEVWILFEMAEGINFAVESEWKSKVSQNVQNLFCF